MHLIFSKKVYFVCKAKLIINKCVGATYKDWYFAVYNCWYTNTDID